MNVFVHQDQQQRGPLPLEQVHEQFARGELKETALVWYEGAADWRPIVPFLEEHPAPLEPAKAPVKVPANAPISMAVPVAARLAAGKAAAAGPGETALFLRTAGITLGLALLLGFGWAAFQAYVHLSFAYIMGVGGSWVCLRVFEAVSRGSGGPAYAATGVFSVVLFWAVGVFGVMLWGYLPVIGIFPIVAFVYSMYLAVRTVA